MVLLSCLKGLAANPSVMIQLHLSPGRLHSFSRLLVSGTIIVAVLGSDDDVSARCWSAARGERGECVTELPVHEDSAQEIALIQKEVGRVRRIAGLAESSGGSWEQPQDGSSAAQQPKSRLAEAIRDAGLRKMNTETATLRTSENGTQNGVLVVQNQESGEKVVSTKAIPGTPVSFPNCTVEENANTEATWLTGASARPGDPCLFGVDARDEGAHCIDIGLQRYGTFGWCWTRYDQRVWGSCSSGCPLAGPMKKLGKVVYEVQNASHHMKTRMENMEKKMDQLLGAAGLGGKDADREGRKTAEKEKDESSDAATAASLYGVPPGANDAVKDLLPDDETTAGALAAALQDQDSLENQKAFQEVLYMEPPPSRGGAKDEEVKAEEDPVKAAMEELAANTANR